MYHVCFIRVYLLILINAFTGFGTVTTLVVLQRSARFARSAGSAAKTPVTSVRRNRSSCVRTVTRHAAVLAATPATASPLRRRRPRRRRPRVGGARAGERVGVREGRRVTDVTVCSPCRSGTTSGTRRDGRPPTRRAPPTWWRWWRGRRRWWRWRCCCKTSWRHENTWRAFFSFLFY